MLYSALLLYHASNTFLNWPDEESKVPSLFSYFVLRRLETSRSYDFPSSMCSKLPAPSEGGKSHFLFHFDKKILIPMIFQFEIFIHLSSICWHQSLALLRQHMMDLENVAETICRKPWKIGSKSSDRVLFLSAKHGQWDKVWEINMTEEKKKRKVRHFTFHIVFVTLILRMQKNFCIQKKKKRKTQLL